MRPTVTVLCVAVLLLAAPAMAASGPSPEEVAKQKAIYQSRGEAVPEGYKIDRSLLSYTFVLPSQFRTSLGKMRAQDRWLDIGAGEGRAVLDYVTSKYDALLRGPEASGQKGKAVAISIEDRRTAQWHETAAALEPGQIQYFFGRRLREYAPEELGQFQVISDVLGAFSYTRYISTFMEKALGLLTVDGELYTVLQDVQPERGKNRPFYPDASFLTEIRNPDGSELKVCSWLKRISCVEVTCRFKAEMSPPAEVYRIRKTCSDVRVPALSLVHFQAGTPPERRFQLSPSTAGKAP
jgi:hypothetical protein